MKKLLLLSLLCCGLQACYNDYYYAQKPDEFCVYGKGQPADGCLEHRRYGREASCAYSQQIMAINILERGLSENEIYDINKKCYQSRGYKVVSDRNYFKGKKPLEPLIDEIMVRNPEYHEYMIMWGDRVWGPVLNNP